MAKHITLFIGNLIVFGLATGNLAGAFVGCCIVTVIMFWAHEGQKGVVQ